MECKITSILVRDVPQVERTATVKEAIRKMAKRRAGSAVVMEGDRVVGFFTERDLMMRVICRELSPSGVQVSDVMSSNLIKVCHDASCRRSLQKMHDNEIRHLLVFDGKQFLGTVSLRNLADLMAQQSGVQDWVVKIAGGAILAAVVGIIGVLLYLSPAMLEIAGRFFSS